MPALPVDGDIARLVGETWATALSLGALVQTKGLMELIVLNIGYDLKIIPPTLFAMLVIMALVTTFATTPILHFIAPKTRTIGAEPLLTAGGKENRSGARRFWKGSPS